MKTKNRYGLAEELRSQEKFPCISLILPVSRTSPGKTTDPERVKQAIDYAKGMLLQQCGEAVAGPLVLELDKLADKVDFLHNPDGLGFFVSPLLSKLVYFPFPVEEKIRIEDTFDLKDILYAGQYYHKYALLTISHKEVRLLKTSGEKPEEVKDKNFPFHFTEEYEYNRPVLGTSFGYSMKEFEKEKTMLQEKRQKAALKTLAGHLSPYIENGMSLLVAGTEKNVQNYLAVADPDLKPAGILHGSYDHHTPEELGQLVRPVLRTVLETENEKLMERLHKALDDQMAVSGIQESWKRASEGKGLHLILEKDFSSPVVLEKNPGEKKQSGDAVNELVRLVLDKNGQVSFVENGLLKAHNKIALILRFKD